MRALQISIVAILIVGTFTTGWYSREYQLLEGPRYLLTQPLELGVASNNSGKLPAGAVLYHYRDLPEISTYVLFVNTKRLDALKVDTRDNHKSFVVDPAEAF